MPGKPLPVNPIVKSDFDKKPINLEALFNGGNPFEASEGAAATVVDTVDWLDGYPTAESEGIDLDAEGL